MLDSIYHMTLKILKIHIFDLEINIFSSFMQRNNERHYLTLRNL